MEGGGFREMSSNAKLNSSGERGHPCLVPLKRQKSSDRRPATSMAVGEALHYLNMMAKLA